MAWQDYRGEMIVGAAGFTGASVAGVIVGSAGGVLTPLGGALVGGAFAVGAILGYLAVKLSGVVDEKKYPIAAKVAQISAAILGGCITGGLTAMGIGMTLLSTATLVLSAQVLLLAIPIGVGAILALILLGVIVGFAHTKLAHFLELRSADIPV